jgi:hypothetical protein
MAAVTARGISDACIVAWPTPLRAAVLSKRCELGHRTNWATVHVPELFWPVWGGALGAATLAYHLRRRGRCPHCGRA